MDKTITFTATQINNCPVLKWLGFEASVEYDVSTLVGYACQYLEPNALMKNNGEHPPKPPKHL